MMKRKGGGRGRGRGAIRTLSGDKFRESEDHDIPVYPSHTAEAQEDEAETRSRPKRKRLGEPTSLTVLNKSKEVADADPLNSVEVGDGRGEVSEKQEADICVVPKKKGRGRTRGLGLQMQREQSEDGKLDVLIHPTKMVAVGAGRKDFITHLSVIVRQNARHNVCKWMKVPQSVKDTIVQKILNNWRLDDTVPIRKAIQDEAGRLYRNWLNSLHSYFLTFKTKEEALKHVSDDINASDWSILVDYFSSPAFETMSAKNKANKAKQTVNHACGRKSFHAVSYDARDVVTGEEPDMRTLWQLTHKRTNGEWVDEASKEMHDKVGQQIVEHSGNEIEIIKTAFKSLVGKKSHMQGIASGSSNRGRVKNGEAELEAQRKETEEAVAKYNEAREKLVEVERQLMEERRKREDLEGRLQDRQRDMDEMKRHVERAIQAALSQPKLVVNNCL